MLLRQDLTRTILALVVGIAALVVVLVVTGVLAPADTRDVGRYLQPFAGLAGTERVVVLVTTAVLLVLAASTVLTGRTAPRRGR